MILQDLKYAGRTMAANPGFTAVAILSLALGIGANTAIFSVWNRVLMAALPVQAPEQLVMLTDPNSSGVQVGSSDGERGLMTYAEFEQIRDQAQGFASVMASESSLGRWPLRVGDGAWTEVRGRMVSGRYFAVLGVPAAIGRTFSADDDRQVAPHAVISHQFWQRSFGGDPGVLGKAITVRKAALTIIGVMPAGFTGETSGDQPDLWTPLRMQSGISPGSDRLRDAGTEKIMWLHVFGRLAPGVSIAQASASANAIFKNGLTAYYGAALPPDKAREFLNQRLVVKPAAGGASRI